ncbi:MAG: carbon-nitrogen hydrolase family protein [Steroidobacteraceae bacterium]
MASVARMIVAAIQMCSGVDVGANIARATHWLARAADAGARLAVLPENFALMARSSAERRAAAETPGDGPVQEAMAQAASRHGLWIVAGTLPLILPDEERVAAASLVFDPAGHCIARYDKIHLFDVDVPDSDESHRESAAIAPGRRVVVVPTPIGTLGLTVCYDLRFAELFRALSVSRAEVLIVPAAFTVPTGAAHWEVLLRARAIESQCDVIASAQTGRHENGRETYGHSMVVDYWGRVLASQPQGEGIVTATLDASARERARERFPVLRHHVL